ncbi:molybdate ABC transporter substrate-binding protein [Marinobacterium lutimaris]|uniref:Molybdate transport system substrate-binding protein n=1 Tax=Marinobacterium lutimaris TaxID=568106 RepID=A0A1H5TGK3_9GAMM|nr:molybdate ABC transporter substrate-binding protein [Marinobacterium lutimaris]SEF61936.1 molybdate transport system substrate-binding protein [Marinobacterium lutimaris]
MKSIKHTLAASSLGLLSMLSLQAEAGEVQAAVAANFTAAAKEIAVEFEKDTGHEVELSFASTGKIYAQITNGAPFDVFFAADAARPQLLVDSGDAVADSLFTYAVGQLVLWSADENRVDADGAVLKEGKLERIAIANPKTAPYGLAAVETLTSLGLWEDMQATTARGDSIAQTYQMAYSGAVPAAMVAHAQIALDDSGSYWMIPQDLYNPIRQQAVLLTKSADNEAAVAWMDYLQGDKAHAIIERYGYGLEQ